MITKTDEEIIRLKKEGLTYQQISERLREQGILKSFDTINHRYLLLKKRGLTEPVLYQGTISASDVVKTSGVLSEAQLRERHDMFFIIMTYLQKIQKGMFIEESQMLKDLGLYGKARYREALSRLEKEYRGKVDGTIYYSNPESISKLKSEGVLQ